MKRLNIDRQNELEPKRIEFAKKQIEALGYEVIEVNTKELNFIYKDNKVCFFPYSGWHQGVGIKAGRGINNLLKQLK